MQQAVFSRLINCDLGECLSPNPDTKIMPLINMANIACGGHAGDDQSVINTLQLAQKNNVKVGAHPSYDDRANFGRISHRLSDDELYKLIHTQVSHFQDLCQQNNVILSYVKPHGALYHDMTHYKSVAGILCKVIKSINPDLALVVQAGNEPHFENIEKNENVTFWREVYADRGYNGLHMIPRGEKGAIFNDSDSIIKQYQHFLAEQSFKIDTICFHSDNKASVEALIQLKNA